MRSVSIAEWMLRRVTTKDRAASIIGDLIEVKSQRGALRFWLSIAGVLFAIAWNWPLAFLAAFYGANWAFYRLQLSAFGMPFDSPHRASITWEPALNLLLCLSTVLWMIAMYATTRYGLRDRMAQLALASASITSLIVCYWWQPLVLTACITLSFIGIFLTLRTAAGRRLTLATMITVAAGFASGSLMLFLGAIYQHWVIPGPTGDRELRAHPSVGWLVFSLWGLAVFATTRTCSLLHQRLTRNALTDQPDAPESIA
jgi:hypothetical protein